MQDVKDKVIIITGSSMGIGKSMAQQLLRAGARVVLNSRGAERLNQTARAFQEQGFQPLAVPGDVSRLDDCRQLIQKTLQHFGHIDLLINNAGVNMRGRIEDISPEMLPLTMDINYTGALYMAHLALPHLKASRGGLVFVSSVAGVHGLPLYGLYSASKMALQALAESLKAELTGTGVYVGIAYVGLTENEAGKTIYDTNGQKTPKEDVAFLGLQPIDVVAAGIIRMIRRRQFRKVFSIVGKLNAFINRISPGLVQYILTRSYKKQNW